MGQEYPGSLLSSPSTASNWTCWWASWMDCEGTWGGLFCNYITHVLRYYPTSCVAASPLNVDYISVDLVCFFVMQLLLYWMILPSSSSKINVCSCVCVASSCCHSSVISIVVCWHRRSFEINLSPFLYWFTWYPQLLVQFSFIAEVDLKTALASLPVTFFHTLGPCTIIGQKVTFDFGL